MKRRCVVIKHQKIEPEVDLTDPDSPEWTEEDFARAKTAEELWGPEYKDFLVRRPGRPPLSPETRKKPVGIRLSPDVLDALKATGPNWQRRADEALRAAFVNRKTA